MKSLLHWMAVTVLSLVLSASMVFASEPTPAKQLFGAVRLPAQGERESIGFYAKGCLMGGVAIPADGPTWQVLHPSRNRRWGNPRMISLIERLSHDAHDRANWNGLLIGDISQPRGGPMLSGHASHQIGLDADIWLTPMPDRKLTTAERDYFPENSVLRKNSLYVDPNKWTASHAKLIMQAASYPEVERIFVHPGIKKKLCDTWGGDRTLLSKVRPMYGHHYHFHIRMKCPAGSPGCTPQVEPGTETGCNGKELSVWFDRLKPRPVPKYTERPKQKPAKPVYLTMASLPRACTMVLNGKSVPSMAAAEYRSPLGLDNGDSDVPMNTETAYAAPADVATAAVAFRSIEDFSDLVPRDRVPVPADRPLQ